MVEARILIADDSKMNQQILSEILGGRYEYLYADDGMQALELLHSEFDIDLLLDINMPRLDGFGVLEVMKQRNWLQEIPVIITSSEDDESFIQKAYELGVTDYIRRPFNLTVTQRRVSNALTLYARQKHLVHLAEEQVYEHEKTNSAITDILLRQLICTFRNGAQNRKEASWAHNKFLPRVLAAAAAMMLLAGCGSKADPGFSPANPVNITIWTYYNGEQLEAFNALVDEFNSTVGKEQGITVESSSHGSVTDLENNVLASAEGKVGAEAMPNIFSAYADTAYALDEMGQIADLSDYLSEEDRAAFIEDYLSEGDFSGSGSIKIFPVAKSAELLFLNETDWEPFAAATGATYDDLATIEGLVSVAERYYEWTDAQTPDIPNDGRAFFGRDAMANYMLIGAKQLGCTIFDAQDGSMTLNFDHDAVRTLWDNYYVPFIKGYFSASGRFRSDDVKTGNIIAYVGSSSSATFFPTQVIADDMDSHDITRKALESPKFANGEDYAVQQGAGMVVTKASDAEIQASLVFLKWFTSPEHNITFSVDSGYLPVTHEGNSIDAIRISGLALSDEMDEVLSAAVDTVNKNHLYTPRAFSGGTNARAILEYSMSDKASADRAAVKEAMAQGQSFEEASAQFLSDECFEAWYQDTLASLEAFQG